jgi:hypothetical protein
MGESNEVIVEYEVASGEESTKGHEAKPQEGHNK